MSLTLTYRHCGVSRLVYLNFGAFHAEVLHFSNQLRICQIAVLFNKADAHRPIVFGYRFCFFFAVPWSGASLLRATVRLAAVVIDCSISGVCAICFLPDQLTLLSEALHLHIGSTDSAPTSIIIGSPGH
jgi:hypothetical protein